MQVFWCERCKTPVIGSINEDEMKAESNPYIDIEDELIEWIDKNDLPNNYYFQFMSYKEKINNYTANNNLSKLKKDLTNRYNRETNLLQKQLVEFALRYLSFKKKEKHQEEKSKKGVPTCPKCGSDIKYMAKDVRPVFMEERILLSVLLEEDYTNKNIWNGVGNRYLVDGQQSDFNLSDLYQVEDLDDKIKVIQREIKNNKEKVDFTSFIEVNKEHFNFIDKNAMDFIKEASEIFSDRLQVVSFSGGKDSTVVSDIVRRASTNKSLLHVFGDTTLEHPFTYKYVKRFKNTPQRPPFLPVDKSERDFFELSKKIGPPSRVMTWCCTIFKTGPIGKLFREIADEQDILTWYGIRRSESNSRSKYDKITISPKIAKQLVVSPIIDWYDVDVWLYILSRGIDFNDAYRLGFSRVGCWLCPNNSKHSEFLTKIYMKERAKKWRNFLIDFAKEIGKPDPEVYVDSGNWKARQGGRGISNSKVAVTLEAEPCGMEELSKNYNLKRPIEEELYELFKPFGELDYDLGSKSLGEVYILDPQDSSPWFALQGRIGSNQLRIKVLKNYNVDLLFNRIECQLRKYQSCINCTACENICPNDAISLQDGYHIDEERCTHCMKCVAYFQKGCIVTKTMMDY